jgi:hypothetical protein
MQPGGLTSSGQTQCAPSSGQWALAEAELRAALSLGPLVEPQLHAEALALLGHLRVM